MKILHVISSHVRKMYVIHAWDSIEEFIGGSGAGVTDMVFLFLFYCGVIGSLGLVLVRFFGRRIIFDEMCSLHRWYRFTW